jgi:hypothetical protein
MDSNFGSAMRSLIADSVALVAPPDSVIENLGRCHGPFSRLV